MQHENEPPRKPRKKRKPPPPLTSEELAFLKQKRFIDEWDLLRLLQVSTTTMYNLIRKKQLVPAWLGGKKMFDIEDIYRRLEESKGKGRK